MLRVNYFAQVTITDCTDMMNGLSSLHERSLEVLFLGSSTKTIKGWIEINEWPKASLQFRRKKYSRCNIDSCID